MARSTQLTIWVVAAAKLAVDLTTTNLVNQLVPKSYMDEPFHVQQTQQYCAGNYGAWDPKITTFPGLYLIGIAWHKLLQLLQDLGFQVKLEPCGTAALRYVNVLLSAACLPVISAILQQQRQQRQKYLVASESVGRKPVNAKPHAKYTSASQGPVFPLTAPSWLWALVLSCMPLHWFYSFLYYTDVGSTLLLLLCYQQAQAGWYKMSGLAGAAAVLFRQTNAVWVAFTLGASVLQITCQISIKGQAGKSSAGSSQVSSRPANLWQELTQTVMGLWQYQSVLVSRLWPLLMVPVAFVVFLIHNKGVTVGDKEAHKPVLHPAQVAYFFLFSAAMLAPLLAGHLSSAARSALKQPIPAICSITAAIACCYVAIIASPPPHPYLLADNRHYTFYVWRRLLARSPTVQQLLVAPAAGLAMALLLHAALQTQQRLWVLGYLLCLAAVLVPAWLLEFRYFTAGLLLLALHLPPPSTLQAFLTLVSYMLVNVGTMYLFLHRPWSWYDDSTARFIW